MLDESTLTQGSALRERRRVLLLCAPVMLLLTLAEVAVLKRFSPALFTVRLLWAAQHGGDRPAAGPPAAERVERSAAGGGWRTTSSRILRHAGLGDRRVPTVRCFPWMLAVPLVIAVVLQELPRGHDGGGRSTMVVWAGWAS